MKLQFKLEKVNSYVLQVPKYCVFLASLYSIYCILEQSYFNAFSQYCKNPTVATKRILLLAT